MRQQRVGSSLAAAGLPTRPTVRLAELRRQPHARSKSRIARLQQDHVEGDRGARRARRRVQCEKQDHAERLMNRSEHRVTGWEIQARWTGCRRRPQQQSGRRCSSPLLAAPHLYPGPTLELYSMTGCIQLYGMPTVTGMQGSWAAAGERRVCLGHACGAGWRMQGGRSPEATVWTIVRNTHWDHRKRLDRSELLHQRTGVCAKHEAYRCAG